MYVLFNYFLFTTPYHQGDGSVQENFLKYVGTKTATLQIFLTGRSLSGQLVYYIYIHL